VLLYIILAIGVLLVGTIVWLVKNEVQGIREANKSIAYSEERIAESEDFLRRTKK